jgi:hypothetical protein
MNPLASTRPAAFPLIPAIHPVETATPASWHSSSVARQRGMWWPLTVPHPAHSLACATNSVIFGAGAGTMSVT